MLDTDKSHQLWQPCAAAEPLSFEIAGQHYAALAWGEPHLPLLVMFHGWLDNAMSFAPLAEQLQQHFRIIAFDWPGHGCSDWRPGSYPLQWVDYLLDMDRMLAALPRKPQVVLGHSLGGIVAGAYAALNSDQFDQLILIEAFAPLHEAPEQARGRLQKSLRQHRQRGVRARHYVELAQLVQQRQQLTGLEHHWCELILARNLATDEQGSYWRIDPRLRWVSPSRMTTEQVASVMTTVRLPTLLLYGTEGYANVQQQLPLAEQWYQALTCQQLAGHHHLHMTHAAATAEAIIRYIAATKV
ncbi:alpha/beta hydrolase [Shewanella sp. C32]|uniref:Alpha/beta hydrolase n=1 Tax=Shewanella electrica TaxID=515560 RepID=A0ABT2FKW5_9GAMM|nr:alpha/beta hydrolase [Shewanella electrica]MCH1923739.1 alpha/beta hydrolase [Shewanella electrica]MCS4556957.1 alpha/beta hydrolase [Shewanella electrica]